MKKITLSELKQLKEVRQIKNEKATDLKGGGVNYAAIIRIDGIMTHTRGFIPPPGI
ncbi:MAG: hypothetical protein AB8B69_01970 [Chitinophagales bacterium]